MYICPLLTQEIRLLTALSEIWRLFYIRLNDAGNGIVEKTEI